jgi:hypothetical protein
MKQTRGRDVQQTGSFAGCCSESLSELAASAGAVVMVASLMVGGIYLVSALLYSVSALLLR